MGAVRTLGSYLTLASSSAFAQAFLLLISPVITRLYAPEDVGGFGIALGVGALLASVGTGRLEHAIPVARNSVDAIQVALLGTTLVSVIALITTLLVLIVPLASVVGPPLTRDFPTLAIPAIAFSLALFQIVNALLLRQKAYRSVGASKILQGGVTGVAQLGLGWCGLGASGLVWAQALGYLVGAGSGVSSVAVKAWVVLRGRGAQFAATFRTRWRFPLVLAPAALFNQAAQQFPVLALGYTYGLYEAGLYALVMRVCGAPLGLLGQTVAQVYAAEFRDFIGDRSGALAQKYLAMLLRLLGIGLLVVGALVLVMNLWGTWLFGAKWANIGTVTLLVSLMLVTDFATTPLSMTLGYLSRERTQLLWDIGRLAAVVSVFVAAHHFSLRFGQLLVLLAVVWSLSLLVHAWLTYLVCSMRGAGTAARG
ncbi:lipopolysaccharide biosynthesis protein [Accumulibacter sp.]|uniref:lipopolysaccharide biosynthesis protein n=1 Tax=Accumulibacter sp. TaxID=2053492 RepID=UPI0025E5162D|nr:oligosaccharide flippase family protein [Accumulibacter sp.]MCM8594237.1 oligosaccharide flippase family protein [Accumulibacter sp.]MCM8625803.1 oligosaccharide flippase family protein [Accumulibacter sp.]MDS4048380.1 oligosaccharide flippase family protein [Accumulibacter sp.]